MHNKDAQSQEANSQPATIPATLEDTLPAAVIPGELQPLARQNAICDYSTRTPKTDNTQSISKTQTKTSKPKKITI